MAEKTGRPLTVYNPGISSFADNPERAGPDHLAELLKHAQEIVPEDAVRDTPIFLLATAGMRLLGDMERQLLLGHVCSYARANSDFMLPDCDVHIQVIPGVTEGLYGWIATNYLLGSFDAPENGDAGKGHNTYGFLDMGGASAQIAFAPNATESQRHADDLTLLRLRNIDGSPQEHRVFVASWLEFGVREARRRYVEALKTASGTDGVNEELPDPCLPAGLRTSFDGESLGPGERTGPSLLGTGKFDECLRQTFPLLQKDAPCPDQPCLLHGVHTPAIDFDINHFVGISEYWHTTNDIFEAGLKDKAYDFNTYQDRVRSFCSQDWSDIEAGVHRHEWGKKIDLDSAHEICFKSSWIINMLHSGIGVPRVGLEDTKGSSHNGTKELLSHGKDKGFFDAFQPVNKIDSTEVSWTLGQIVLYASSQVPLEMDEDLPVGFGSNVPGIPDDFQYPSAEFLPDSGDLHTENWDDLLFNGDSPRRIPGLLLFLFIIVLAAFVLCGRGRRRWIYYKVNCLVHRGTPPRASHPKGRRLFGGKLPFFGRKKPSYERVLEEGARDYDLGVADSDEDELSCHPSPDSANFRSPKRSSSWGSNTPSLKYELDNSSTGTVGLGITSGSMDRTGLALRTEGRDHLAPVALGPTINGRRSRTGSPARSHHAKSPFLTPRSHD